MIKLVIVDLDPCLLFNWSEVFREIPEVIFVNTDFKTLLKLPGLDAVLVRWIFAHERYGGAPKINESQILSTNKEIEMPPWVITTPPLRFDSSSLPESYDYIEFTKIFETINQFNKTNKEYKILTVGFEISFLYGFRDKPLCREAEAVKRSYLENYNKL